jgi:hypothetical protein
MSAAQIASGQSRSRRPLEPVRLLLHLLALGVAYDGVGAAVRVARSVVARARRRTHTVASPPRTIHESLGLRS